MGLFDGFELYGRSVRNQTVRDVEAGFRGRQQSGRISGVFNLLGGGRTNSGCAHVQPLCRTTRGSELVFFLRCSNPRRVCSALSHSGWDRGMGQGMLQTINVAREDWRRVFTLSGYRQVRVSLSWNDSR